MSALVTLANPISLSSQIKIDKSADFLFVVFLGVLLSLGNVMSAITA